MIKMIQVVTLLLCYWIGIYSQVIIGPPEEIYPLGDLSSYNCSGCSDTYAEIWPWVDSDDAWPHEWFADGVVCHLKKNDDTIITFWPSPNRVQRWEGTLENPRINYKPINSLGQYSFDGFVEEDYIFDGIDTYYAGGNQTVAVYLHNIYKVPSENKLIGFTHNEIFDDGEIDPSHPRYYSIGIVYSDDFGDTWEFLGEIIRPGDNNKGAAYNIHGVPYLVANDSFYVYFRDYLGPGEDNICVAKARVSDVVTDAENGALTTWHKYKNNSWSEDGMTGEGSNILPYPNGTWTHDIHADAVQFPSGASSSYMIIATMCNYTNPNNTAVFLYQSNDGIHWKTPREVANYNGFDIFYPTILSLKGAADDGHAMSGSFYIYYPKKPIPHPNGSLYYGNYYSFVRHKVSLDIGPSVNMLLLD
jgi:hypothetical protein